MPRFSRNGPKHLFRATVWHLSSVAACVDGDAGLTRYVTEGASESADMFEAEVRDRYLSDVDADITLGPITDKGPIPE